MRWLITNRNQQKDIFGSDLDELTFWTFDVTQKNKDIAKRSSWTKRDLEEFKTALVKIRESFLGPSILPRKNKNISRYSFTDMTTPGRPRYAATTRLPNNSLTARILWEN